jgi:hypothetical protein
MHDCTHKLCRSKIIDARGRRDKLLGRKRCLSPNGLLLHLMLVPQPRVLTPSLEVTDLRVAMHRLWIAPRSGLALG